MTHALCEGDTSLGEIVESIFPLNTEFAILIWNDIYIPMTYKYDVSVILDDLMTMLTLMMNSEHGKRVIHWPSNTFHAKWNLEWSANIVTIFANWESVIGGTEDLLNSVPDLSLEKQVFISEWGNILDTILNSIYGVQNLNISQVDLSQLQFLVKEIGRKGVLYIS